jgi:hypothetical protein
MINDYFGDVCRNFIAATAFRLKAMSEGARNSSYGDELYL